MIIFLLTFLFLYGGINYYAFFRADSVFHFSTGIKIVLLIVLAILIGAPILVRMAESRNLEALARVIAYAGYIWMAFVFLFFILNISFELIRCLYKFWHPAASPVLLRTPAFGLAALIAAGLVVYGYIDAQRIRVKNLEIATQQIFPGSGKLRIVQISDVHVGLIIKEKRLQLLLDKIRGADPDILVSTGDLLDGELNNVKALAELLAQIKPKFGKYAVTGNHEYYAGIEKSLEFTRQAGFTVLRDEIKQVAGINIAGVDDITGRRSGIVHENSRLTQAMPPIQNDKFVLLLKHQPYINDQDNFDLQLSGHTHGGQIFPFRLVTGLYFKNNYGHYELGKNKRLYVSRGVGTWGPPVRIFAPPEITVIDLIGKKAT